MGNFLLNARYLLAPVLIIVAGAGVLIGGIMAWLGVALLFVGLLVDIATKFETTGVGVDENGDTEGHVDEYETKYEERFHMELDMSQDESAPSTIRKR